MKFVRITKKWGKRLQYEDKYDGILISETKTDIEFIGVGPQKTDKIEKMFFDKTESETKYKITQISKLQVDHFFKLALLASSNKLNDAYFDLMDRKRFHILAKEHYKTVFGKMPIFENIELEGI